MTLVWIIAVVVLLFAAAVLLAAEAFIIPGFGAVGVLGAALLAAAGFVAWHFLGGSTGAWTFGLGLAAAVALAAFVIPRSRLGQAMVLTEVQQSHAADPTWATWVGKTGRALTPLRPSGTIELADRTVDVVTDGRFIEAGTEVRVTLVEGARIVVEPVRDYHGGGQ